MGFAKQQMDAGKRLPGAWLIDHEGNATDDPGALFGEPKGALLPLGGLDAGYKGFSLALLIEALTAGLSGYGRADPPEGWGGTVFVQVLDPEAFGGLAGFKRQMDHMVLPPTRRRPARASRACACRAKPVWRGCASSVRTASPSTRRSCRRSLPGRKSSAWPFPARRCCPRPWIDCRAPEAFRDCRVRPT